ARRRRAGAGPMTGRPGRRAGATRRVFYGWWMVAGLCVTELLSWGTLVYTFGVLVVPMHAELGWSTAQLNGAYTTGVVVSGLVAVPVGRWLHSRGARGVMTTGSLLGVAALLGWAGSESLVTFYATFAVAGLAMAAMLYEPAFAVTATWFHRQRPRAVLMLTIAGGLSSTVFVPLTGVLIDSYGWRTTLVILAVTLAVVTIPIHAGLLRRWPADLGLASDGRDPATHESGTEDEPPPQGGDHHPRVITRSSTFRWLTVSMVAHTAGKMAPTVTLVAYLIDRGYPMSQATLAVGGVGLFQVLGRVLTTALRQRVPEHRVVGTIYLLQGVALPVSLLTTGHGPAATVSVVVTVVCFGLGYGLPDLLRGTLLADYAGSRHFARVNGLMSTYVVAARAAGPLIAGFTLTAFSSHGAILIGAALLMLVSAYALHRAVGRPARPPRRPGERITEPVTV
ncbi:MAG: MFS transporter, partial [Nocardioidaceae bacterium]